MNYYDQLIDKALEIRDFEWVKELVRLKEESKSKIVLSNNREILPKLKALEDLTDNYVVKQEHGLRNIIFTSDDDILQSKIVELKNYTYKDGIYTKQNEEVEYSEFDSSSEYVLKYYLLGYKTGIKFGHGLEELTKSINKSDIRRVNFIKKYGLNN